MGEFKRQTYDNTYFFSLPGMMEKHHKHITKFIMDAERIDKRDKAFKGIIEDIKRYSKESIIYTLLMHPDIILAYGVEMPGTFKVFSAKDMKYKSGTKIFIDVSKLIEYNSNGGFFVCKDLSELITYLMQASTWILYNFKPITIINNSNITMAGAECFTALFDYVLGYFSFRGYSENRYKIWYLVSMYYLVRMLGKEDDAYSRGIAAKIAKLPSQQVVDAYSTYYDAEKDFFNIDTFITMLAKTFKMTGLDTQVFVDKWRFLCGNNAIYAVDLFTAFSNVVIAAYMGSYSVNKKSIEKFAGQSMVKFYNAIKKAAIDNIESNIYESEESYKASLVHDKATEILIETLEKKSNKAPSNASLRKTDCKSKTLVLSKVQSMMEFYINNEQKEKISGKLVSFAKTCINAMDTNTNTGKYEIGCLTNVLSGKKNITADDKNKIK